MTSPQLIGVGDHTNMNRMNLKDEPEDDPEAEEPQSDPEDDEFGLDTADPPDDVFRQERVSPVHHIEENV
jgi:hypothetical protein